MKTWKDLEVLMDVKLKEVDWTGGAWTDLDHNDQRSHPETFIQKDISVLNDGAKLSMTVRPQGEACHSMEVTWSTQFGASARLQAVVDICTGEPCAMAALAEGLARDMLPAFWAMYQDDMGGD